MSATPNSDASQQRSRSLSRTPPLPSKSSNSKRPKLQQRAEPSVTPTPLAASNVVAHEAPSHRSITPPLVSGEQTPQTAHESTASAASAPPTDAPSAVPLALAPTADGDATDSDPDVEMTNAPSTPPAKSRAGSTKRAREATKRKRASSKSKKTQAKAPNRKLRRPTMAKRAPQRRARNRRRLFTKRSKLADSSQGPPLPCRNVRDAERRKTVVAIPSGRKPPSLLQTLLPLRRMAMTSTSSPPAQTVTRQLVSVVAEAHSLDAGISHCPPTTTRCCPHSPAFLQGRICSLAPVIPTPCLKPHRLMM